MENVKKVCGRDDVISAFESVDRNSFLPYTYKKYASVDMPVPIGDGQTTSQPSLIADMICKADIKRGHKVLEIGTGTGYAAAIMATIGAEVYTTERLEKLYKQALRNLSIFPNVRVFLAGESLGLPDHAPFERIIVFAYYEEIPIELVNQLSNDGIMIIPIGDEFYQHLYKIKKVSGEVYEEKLYPVRFVPLIW